LELVQLDQQQELLAQQLEQMFLSTLPELLLLLVPKAKSLPLELPQW
jgi:hypothetical protein